MFFEDVKASTRTVLELLEFSNNAVDKLPVPSGSFDNKVALKIA